MSIFGAYSKYYNLLYKDKDYAGEVRYIQGLIQKYTPDAGSILDLGCGTGWHDFEFAKLGYQVTGIDISEEMLAVANSRLSSSIADHSKGSSSFFLGDIRTIRINQIFDVVVSLFHVMSYQITDEDLQAVFSTAKAHLNPGGLVHFRLLVWPCGAIRPSGSQGKAAGGYRDFGCSYCRTGDAL